MFVLRLKQTKRFFSSKKPGPVTSLDYCMNVVRQHDYENFMATLLLNKDFRTPAFVVRAFNVEVARIQDVTTDSKIAEIRLQFWYETVQEIFKKEQDLSKIPKNPIAQELYKVYLNYKIPKRNLERLIKSRNNYLKTKYFNTLDEIEKYSEETVSTLYYTILNIANITNVHADHVASHLGKAQGLTNLLRSVNVSSKHKIISLPLDLLTKHGVSQENVLRCIDDKNMRDVTFDVACRAKSHLEKAREINISKDIAPIFLSAVAVSRYLKHLEKCDFNLFHKSLQKRSALLPLLLYYNYLSKKY